MLQFSLHLHSGGSNLPLKLQWGHFHRRKSGSPQRTNIYNQVFYGFVRGTESHDSRVLIHTECIVSSVHYKGGACHTWASKAHKERG